MLSFLLVLKFHGKFDSSFLKFRIYCFREPTAIRVSYEVRPMASCLKCHCGRRFKTVFMNLCSVASQHHNIQDFSDYEDPYKCTVQQHLLAQPVPARQTINNNFKHKNSKHLLVPECYVFLSKCIDAFYKPKQTLWYVYLIESWPHMELQSRPHL